MLVGLAALGTIFWREAAGAFTVWIESPTFNHGFLILPIVLYMMWTRRSGVASLPHRPAVLASLLVLPLSFAWLLTAIVSVLEAQQFVVIAILQVVLVATLGWPVYRRFAAPFLYLFFLVPSGAELVPALQQTTAHFAVIALKLVGVPVYSNGAVIEIPAGTFAVAEACAGLRFLIATVAFGVFYAAQIYRGVLKRLIFVAFCIVVPILANGLRVFGIIWAAQLLGSPTAAVADHLIYGWAFFSLVLILLVFVGRAFADQDMPAPSTSSVGGEKTSPARVLTAGALAAVAAAVFPAIWLLLGESSAAAFPATPPSVLPPWQHTANDSGWTPVLVGPSRTFAAAYSEGHDTVYSYIALYPARGRTNNLVRSNNRLADEKDWKLNSSRFRDARCRRTHDSCGCDHNHQWLAETETMVVLCGRRFGRSDRLVRQASAVTRLFLAPDLLIRIRCHRSREQRHSRKRRPEGRSLSFRHAITAALSMRIESAMRRTL